MLKEIWKDVKDYEGLYQVSNLGRVKSLDRYIPNTNGVGVRMIKGVILKTTINNSGYETLALHRDGRTKRFLVHRLVGLTFIPNPENLSDINHIDENKFNNCVDNLEWMSHIDNMNYGDRNKKAGENRKGKLILSEGSNASKVINLDTNKIFGSIKEASMFYDINASGISQNCRGKSSNCGGYHWMYYEDYLNMTTLGEVMQ